MIYLDHNATTPPSPAVLAAMQHALQTHWANASSSHAPGQAAKRALLDARNAVARQLGCKPAEVVLTSGATEANHLAVRGLLGAAPKERQRVLFSAIEHAGHLRLAKTLTEAGVQVDYLPVLPSGALDLDAARGLIRPDLALVSMMAANNETGVLLPIAAIAALARTAGVPLHLDATQWIGKLPFVFEDCGAQAVSLSAHKFQGPKGTGALLLRRGLFLTPIFPGSQERGRRGGTENLSGIVGMATALQSLGDVAVEAARIARLRDRLEAGLCERLPQVHIWSRDLPRLPGTSYLRFGTLSADVVLQRLGSLGIAASSGSACAAGGSEPSHVLRAMGVPRDEGLCAVRLSLGCSSTEADVDFVLAQLPPLLLALLGEVSRSQPDSSTMNGPSP